MYRLRFRNVFLFLFFRLLALLFCSYEHIFQIRLVTINYKRKVILSYHNKNCVAGARRDFLFLAFPLHVKGFLGHQKCEVFSKRRRILITNHTAHALKGMIPYFVLAFSRRRAKTIRILVYVWSRNGKNSLFFKNIRIREDEV